MPGLYPYPIPGIKSYFGGKAGDGVYQTIINQIPPHDVFISPFLGACAVTRFKKPAMATIGIDADAEVTDAWKNIKPRSTIIITGDALSLLNYICTGKNQRTNHMIGNLRQCLNRIGSNYNDIKNGAKIFIYADPPYLITTRKSDTTRYKYEMTEAEHEQLLSLLLKVPAMVAISTYDNDLYREKLEGWRKIQFTARTRGASAVETLYMNYPEPVELHDYSYLGTDYRERERISRKIKRHVAQLKAMPDLERMAILEALTSAGNAIKSGTTGSIATNSDAFRKGPSMEEMAEAGFEAHPNKPKQLDLVEVIEEIKGEK
jgi:DNA adenine methylase